MIKNDSSCEPKSAQLKSNEGFNCGRTASNPSSRTNGHGNFEMKKIDDEINLNQQPISASFPESMNGLIKHFDDRQSLEGKMIESHSNLNESISNGGYQ